MPLESSPESPLPVRTVARSIGEWIARLGRVWIEGQITELRRRGAGTGFMVLRDPVADMSLRVSCAGSLLDSLDPPLHEGNRVIVHAKPEFWPGRGDLSLVATDIRPVGVGALLARLEQLRALLAAEGLFAAEHKKQLPMLPRAVGLITGRGSAAERDVVDNARRRWPGVEFRIANVAVQGPTAASNVIEALGALDKDPDVDVIVIARGGGSVEDLLPFSDELLIRAVFAAFTPVVSAVGHESDVPLIDHVADRRASTPTDAAKLIVPDMAEETARIAALAARANQVIAARLRSEQDRLDALIARPAFADPAGTIDRMSSGLHDIRERSRRAALHCVTLASTEVATLGARVTALSPQATLDRGYSVLQRDDGNVIRSRGDATVGERLSARVADGTIAVVVEESV